MIVETMTSFGVQNTVFPWDPRRRFFISPMMKFKGRFLILSCVPSLAIIGCFFILGNLNYSSSLNGSNADISFPDGSNEVTFRLPISSFSCSSAVYAPSVVEDFTQSFRVVRSCGNLMQRVDQFNLELDNMREIARPDLIYDWKKISPASQQETVWGNKEDFFVSLSEFNQVKTIFLDWQGISEIGAEWSSLNDTSNLLIQSYHALTGSDQLCTWIETPGKTSRRYDKAFNRTCNRAFQDLIPPISLNPTIFTQSDDSPEEQTFETPQFITYLHVVNHGLVSIYGEVFSGNLRFIPHGCLVKFSDLPSNANEFPLFHEVFVITQFWGDQVFHRMIEILPRIAFYLDFLKRHPDIRIITGEKAGGQLGEFLKILGLDPRRIRLGWCRANIVYLPRPTVCGIVNLHEIQLLSQRFRAHIERSFPGEKRNRLILIRRSETRRFTEQVEIERVVQKAAKDHNLTYTLFPDDPVPSLNFTMRIFKAAIMVVAPHGAGLSNIVFSDPGTFVVEGVCNLPHLNLCFFRLAHVLGHRWHGIPSNKGCEQVINVPASSIEYTVRQYLKFI